MSTLNAIFVYIFIYFIGYYGSSVFNILTVRPLITNRFLAALVPVFAFTAAHAYMIVSKPPPASQNITVESALFYYVVMPVIIVILGAIYFMWSARSDTESEENNELDNSETEDLIDSISEESKSNVESLLEKSDKASSAGQTEENDHNKTS